MFESSSDLQYSTTTSHVFRTCVCVSQLEDGHSLFDYDVGLNDIIQLMIRPLPDSAHSAPPPDETTNGEACSQEDMETVRTKCCSSVVTGLTSFPVSVRITK